MTDRTEAGVDLTNCDREPIHIPGAILPHGALLAVDPETLQIEQIAGDVAGLFGADAALLVGSPLSAIFDERQIERLRGLIESSSLARPRHLLDPLLRVVIGRPVDASVHLIDGVMVIEVEDADLADRHAMDPLASVQEMFDGLAETHDLSAFCQHAAERVRFVTGYDRVMVYQFLHDESGWVCAEARDPEMAPFLDLHYPASDIPQQARALYRTSWLRLITAVDYTPAPLLPPINPRSGRPLDMSYATLRDVSPIHREYLRNMGVDGSMSISIISEGRLWGLIACHHRTPRRLPRHLRAVCELFGSMFSLQLEARVRADELEARLRSRTTLAEIMQALAPVDDYADGLVAQERALLAYLADDARPRGGVAISVDGVVTPFGSTPSVAQIDALSTWLTTHMQDFEGVFATDRLGELYPPGRDFAGVASGVLAISVSRDPQDFVFWFRPEVIANVRWAGDPRKPVTFGVNGARLTPRKSFESWAETVRGHSTPWRKSERDAAFDLRVSLLEVVLRRIDATARARQRAWEQERLLMAELDHRVKNTLANIQAMVWQSSRSATSLTAFTEGLDRRIRSLSRAHSLLTQSRWEGVSIAGLIHEELDAYQADPHVIAIEGPAVTLTPKAALAISLAVHELATNAAKYGALSSTTGRLDVSWQIDRDGTLALSWRESGGPIVTEPSRRGFGSTLIERALAMETGGKSQLRFAPSGVVCLIVLPVAAIQKIESANPPAAAPAIAASTPAPIPPAPAKRRVLVVEDSALVLMAIEYVLANLGWDLVGPATRLSEAVPLAREARLDAALLDVNLDGEMSWEVAEILQDRGVPFAFTTGYDGAMMLPERFAGQPIINKPFDGNDVLRTLGTLTREAEVGVG
ncbi:HWE histidine kinase domain-containing protein [Sphingomonas sp. RB3P16]|uniref:HWE histidine kinase domain-containing protein n=1 Tax=Parasphingomonas frigoris TaxID=3096163 RepID=UPI002FC5A412